MAAAPWRAGTEAELPDDSRHAFRQADPGRPPERRSDSRPSIDDVQFEGRVVGETIEGTATSNGSKTSWKAARAQRR